MDSTAISGVTKRFGTVAALGGVSLRVNAGEFVALVGPSGCDKTTLMRILAGIERADGGLAALVEQCTSGASHSRNMTI